ncbi:hypothetical protein DJ465_13055 [Staphylococcus pseudintermedius]|uniref:hypothetical protein n=1 Tax=Staphylococcus TaxID=1279 RepID=UPI000449D505|nr:MULTISPECIES: hypothetical protein [Staphylococcus]EGQ3269352.1 hypothetical protein [Staphylococcus pseudintermedius]EIA4829780.1 hypothetical protein [Staphylococcus pseudintermedius]EIE3867214.1 hypothetical protein [Staphylococcus pseudintermedius]EII2749023.1 hypothetical protein [Staphylococcus pseudintermedius]EIK0257463.1 hypothetical protein [Staphylococcus pseudintermedius]
MADIQKMLEQKEKLQMKIKEEKKKEYEKFGRWFFNKFDVNRSADAKKIINVNLLNIYDSEEQNLEGNEIIEESRNNKEKNKLTSETDHNNY